MMNREADWRKEDDEQMMNKKQEMGRGKGELEVTANG